MKNTKSPQRRYILHLRRSFGRETESGLVQEAGSHLTNKSLKTRALRWILQPRQPPKPGNNLNKVFYIGIYIFPEI